MVRAALPGSPIVGDSTEPVYAGNLFFEPDAPGGWFNSAMGFGTLGYALPAAIGCALADPSRPVVALAGDGGLQFTLPELGTAADERAHVILLVWNNHGYREIESAMLEAGAEPIGVTPRPPDFVGVAGAYGIPAERLESLEQSGVLVRRVKNEGDVVKVVDKTIHAKETQPPGRYGAGRLINVMEDLGLGTKATRPNIIQNLYDRGYVHDDPLVPTEKGVKVAG